jgi:hypothetical protein
LSVLKVNALVHDELYNSRGTILRNILMQLFCRPSGSTVLLKMLLIIGVRTKDF